MRIADAVKESFDVVESKGFHSKPRHLLTYTALFHSEVSEALEDIRDGKDAIYYEWTEPIPGVGPINKPCGEATELVDLAIRIFDYAGVTGWSDLKIGEDDTTEAVRQAWLAKSEKQRKIDAEYLFMGEPSEFMGFLHLVIDEFAQIMLQEKPDTGKYCLGSVLYAIYVYFLNRGWDFEATYREKTQFNKTRSFRHGNKTV